MPPSPTIQIFQRESLVPLVATDDNHHAWVLQEQLVLDAYRAGYGLLERPAIQFRPDTTFGIDDRVRMTCRATALLLQPATT